MSEKIYDVCVIGGGSAGTMAALRTVLNNDECLFFPGSPQDKKRSRALWVRKVENMPAHLQYKRGIEDPNAETIKWIQQSDFKDKLTLQKNLGITKLSKNENGIFELTDHKENTYQARYIILCTGVMDVQPVIKGTIETVFDYANAQTIDYCLICDGHHVLNKKTSVIGHENSAAWVAILLFERYGSPDMTILTNGRPANFQPDTQKLIDLYKIQVQTASIEEIIGEEKGKILKAFKLGDGKTIETDISFVALGMIVYNDLAKQLGAELDERGFVKASDSGLTSVPGLYVAGDLKANTRKQIYTAWDHAVSAASAINLLLRSERRKRLLDQVTT
jgi:thioredoxin reductase (NADPH)